jgi:hypothetical protein
VRLGIGGGDRVRDRLQDGGLAGFGRGDDEAALALADGGDQVDDPRGGRRVAGFEAEPLVGIDGGEIVEVTPAAGLGGGQPVDGVDADQRLAWPGGALDQVALAQSELPSWP